MQRVKVLAQSQQLREWLIGVDQYCGAWPGVLEVADIRFVRREVGFVDPGARVPVADGAAWSADVLQRLVGVGEDDLVRVTVPAEARDDLLERSDRRTVGIPRS